MANLFGKNWYTDPTGIPARVATSSIVNPSRPPSASRSRAAVRIASNRTRPRAWTGRWRTCRSGAALSAVITGGGAAAGSVDAGWGWPPLSWRNWSQIW